MKSDFLCSKVFVAMPQWQPESAGLLKYQGPRVASRVTRQPMNKQTVNTGQGKGVDMKGAEEIFLKGR